MRDKLINKIDNIYEDWRDKGSLKINLVKTTSTMRVWFYFIFHLTYLYFFLQKTYLYF